MAGTDLGNSDHQDNMNGKPSHQHLPQIASGGGGELDCNICSMALMTVSP